MFMKSFIILGGAASLFMAAAPADAQSRRAYCDDYARRSSYHHADAGNVVGGAVAGAALGGVVGAITGNGHASNIATGVAVGGVTGGVVGAASQGRYDGGNYDEIFARCMDRGNFISARPVRYSRAVEWCASRHRSYNPDTGTYITLSGRARHCP